MKKILMYWLISLFITSCGGGSGGGSGTESDDSGASESSGNDNSGTPTSSDGDNSNGDSSSNSMSIEQLRNQVTLAAYDENEVRNNTPYPVLHPIKAREVIDLDIKSVCDANNLTTELDLVNPNFWIAQDREDNRLIGFCATDKPLLDGFYNNTGTLLVTDLNGQRLYSQPGFQAGTDRFAYNDERNELVYLWDRFSGVSVSNVEVTFIDILNTSSTSKKITLDSFNQQFPNDNRNSVSFTGSGLFGIEYTVSGSFRPSDGLLQSSRTFFALIDANRSQSNIRYINVEGLANFYRAEIFPQFDSSDISARITYLKDDKVEGSISVPNAPGSNPSHTNYSYTMPSEALDLLVDASNRYANGIPNTGSDSNGSADDGDNIDCNNAWQGDQNDFQVAVQCETACVYAQAGQQQGVDASCNILDGFNARSQCSVCN